jgi:hypothetical protein
MWALASKILQASGLVLAWLKPTFIAPTQMATECEHDGIFSLTFIRLAACGEIRRQGFSFTVRLQKYLEKGNEHPFEAGGWVAAACVFIIVGAVALIQAV